MGTLSNIPLLKGLFGAQPVAPATIRAARPEEFDLAIRLLLASHNYAIEERQIQDFVRLAFTHRNTACGLLVAEAAGRIVSAVMPVTSPGHTMLVFLPNIIAGDLQTQATRQLVEEVCIRGKADSIHLAQGLLDPGHVAAIAILSATGFHQIAELLYLQATITRATQATSIPTGYRWENYSPATHALFARAIQNTYQQSLDCPALSGLRNMDDVIAGHKATGEFDPSIWFAICCDEEPAGVLILSRAQQGQMLELVYIGLVPEHRGRGLGDLLMRKALETAVVHGSGNLSLAVDSANKPALGLYWRHGLRTIGRKIAMIRELR